jgi:hypothetical protein
MEIVIEQRMVVGKVKLAKRRQLTQPAAGPDTARRGSEMRRQVCISKAFHHSCCVVDIYRGVYWAKPFPARATAMVVRSTELTVCLTKCLASQIAIKGSWALISFFKLH